MPLRPEIEASTSSATPLDGGSVPRPDDSSAADFVRRFSDFWQTPVPNQLHLILTEDVRLVQPLSRTTIGLVAARESFEKLFLQLPSLRARVDRWRGDEEVVFIEFRLHATLAGQRIEWPAVDRFSLRGGLAFERVSYFDSLPVTLKLLRHPGAALRAILR